MKFFCLLLLFFWCNFIFAQQLQRCASTDIITYYDQKFPGYSNSVSQTFAHAKGSALSKSVDSIYRIPVVVHVVYNTPAQNIADSVIEDQLRILNEDFLRENSDTSNLRSEFLPIVGSSRISFELASFDPSGDPTNGVTRTYTATQSFGSQGIFSGDMTDLEKVKSTSDGGKDSWDPSRYMNIWVCNMAINGTPTVLGYSTPPANLPNWPGNSGIETLGDGVVIQFEAFGSNNPTGIPGNYIVAGRTTTHEVGHYLGLRHIWGDESNCNGNDGIDDTPKAASSSDNQCDTSRNTCIDNIEGLDLHDMLENFMDYSRENCQNAFTKGQSSLMRAVVKDHRSALITNNEALGLSTPVDYVHLYPNPATNFLVLSSNEKISAIVFIDPQGKEILEIAEPGQNISIDKLSSGLYLTKIVFDNGQSSIQRILISR